MVRLSDGREARVDSSRVSSSLESGRKMLKTLASSSIDSECAATGHLGKPTLVEPR